MRLLLGFGHNALIFEKYILKSEMVFGAAGSALDTQARLPTDFVRLKLKSHSVRFID